MGSFKYQNGIELDTAKMRTTWKIGENAEDLGCLLSSYSSCATWDLGRQRMGWDQKLLATPFRV